MQLKEITEFASKQNDRLDRTYLCGYDYEKKVLHALAKLSEESGELSDVVLKNIGAQRKEKVRGVSKEDVGDEIADVIICAAILADLMEIDLVEAIKNKNSKLEARYDEAGNEVSNA